MIEDVIKKRIKDLNIIELLKKALADNADIKKENKYYFFLIMLASMKIESGFKANAKNPKSTATGLGQIVAGTFQHLKDTHKAKHPEIENYDLTNPEHAIFLSLRLYADNYKSINSYYRKLSEEDRKIIKALFGGIQSFENNIKYLIYAYAQGIGAFKTSANQYIKDVKANELKAEKEKKEVTFTFRGGFDGYWSKWNAAYQDFKAEYQTIPEDDADTEVDANNEGKENEDQNITADDVKTTINQLPTNVKEKIINKVKEEPDTINKLSNSEKSKFNKLKKLQYGEGVYRKKRNKLLNEYMILSVINKILLK
jgi:hypothetical protein